MFAKQREAISETFHTYFTLCEKRQRKFLGEHPKSTMFEVPENELQPQMSYIKYTVDCNSDRRTFYGPVDKTTYLDWVKATENCQFSPVNENGNYYMRAYYPSACMIRAEFVYTDKEGKARNRPAVLHSPEYRS